MSSINALGQRESFYHHGCAQFRHDPIAQEVYLVSPAGADMYDLPGLHSSDSLAYCYWTQSGDFSLDCHVSLESEERFDAAGIYLETDQCRLKYGIERYRDSYRIASVILAPYSDESTGVQLESHQCRLTFSKHGNIFSCYVYNKEQLDFHRAFYLCTPCDSLKLGFYTQSPFSRQGAGRFKFDLNPIPVEHQRP